MRVFVITNVRGGPHRSIGGSFRIFNTDLWVIQACAGSTYRL